MTLEAKVCNYTGLSVTLDFAKTCNFTPVPTSTQDVLAITLPSSMLIYTHIPCVYIHKNRENQAEIETHAWKH